MMDRKVFKIAVFPGDRIGPKIMREVLKCLAVISETLGLSETIEVDPLVYPKWQRTVQIVGSIEDLSMIRRIAFFRSVMLSPNKLSHPNSCRCKR